MAGLEDNPAALRRWQTPDKSFPGADTSALATTIHLSDLILNNFFGHQDLGIELLNRTWKMPARRDPRGLHLLVNEQTNQLDSGKRLNRRSRHLQNENA